MAGLYMTTSLGFYIGFVSLIGFKCLTLLLLEVQLGFVGGIVNTNCHVAVAVKAFN
jgi:hypothetical protein